MFTIKKFSLNCFIDQNIYIRNPFNLSISKNCSINRGCEFFTSFQDSNNGSIKLEENVTLSPNVKIYAIAQDPHSKNFDTIAKPVLIKENAWICADVTILPGVIIGKNAVVASKAIVNKSVNENEIWGGNPIKKIKNRFNENEMIDARRINWEKIDKKEISDAISEFPNSNDIIKKFLS